MNNRIMAALCALVIAMFISVVPVKADASSVQCTHPSIVEVPAKAATCTEDGNVKYYKCANPNCGIAFSGKTVIDPTTYVIGKTGHKWVVKFDTAGHWDECSVCKARQYDAAHTLTYRDNKDGKHVEYCSYDKCGYSATVSHVDEDKNCKCDGCQAQLTHTPGTKYETDADYHWFTCTVCGTGIPGEAHTPVWEKDDLYHTKKCSVCDYVYFERAEHSYGNTTPNGDGTHSKVCGDAECKYVLTENCTEGGTHDCKCDACGTELEHTLGWANDAKDHWKVCKVCSASATKQEYGAHKFICVPSENDNDRHVVKCETCGYIAGDEDCTDSAFDNDCKCDKCGDNMNHAKDQDRMKWVEKVSVTCEADGMDEHYVCRTCGLLLDKNGAPTTAAKLTFTKLGHNLRVAGNAGKWNWKADALTGEHWKACSNYGCKYTTEKATHKFEYELCADDWAKHSGKCECGATTKKLDHKFNDKCVCTDCGYKMAHTDANTKYVAGKDATCITDGIAVHRTCKTCGKNFVNGNGNLTEMETIVIKATGHTGTDIRLSNGEHVTLCTVCKQNATIPHNDKDGDCKCDINSCGIVVHSHQIKKVKKIEATCQKAGQKAYWYFEGCGKMFSDSSCTKPITAPIVIPIQEHALSEWINEGVSHVQICEDCGLAQNRGNHADVNGDNRCDICKVELSLTYVDQVNPTCTDIGYKGYWVSLTTNIKYADKDGNVRIDAPEVIPATGHTFGNWMPEGTGHVRECVYCGAEQSGAHRNTNGGCFCEDCFAAVSGHVAGQPVPYKAPTCETAGMKGYVKCSCGQYFDLVTMQPTTLRELTIPATGHVFNTGRLVNNNAGDNHYITCKICGNPQYMEHETTVENPLKGNYHQFVCACGETEVETHCDNNGDKKCDKCAHDMSGTAVQVTQHDNKTVTAGNPATVNNTFTWWRNFLENVNPSNTGGASTSRSSSTQAAAPAAQSQAPAQQQTQTQQQTQQQTQTQQTQQTQSTAQQQAPAAVQSTGIINEIIVALTQFFSSLFGF